MIKTLIKTSMVCALGAGLTGCLSGAENFSDGTEDQATANPLMQQVMSVVGVGDPGIEPINYKERAPLVMPKDLQKLPKPDERSKKELAVNWPSDNRAEQLAKLREFYKTEDISTPLTPEQMRGHPSLRNAVQRSGRDFAREKREAQVLDGRPLSNEELQKMQEAYRNAKDQNTDTRRQICLEDAEKCKPQRRYLTDPPLDYSTPAPGYALISNDDQLREEVKKRKEEAAIMDGKRIKMK